MKRRIAAIAILAVLLLCGTVWARMTTVVVGQGVSAVPSECTGYLVCQNFEGTGYDNSESWTEYNGSGSTVDEDYGTAIRGSQSLRIIGGTDWGETYSNFTASGEIYGFVRIRPVDLPAGATNIISVRDGVTELLNIQLRADGTVSSQGPNNTAYGSYAMSVGTTYYMWFYYKKGTGANAEWWVRISNTTTMPGSNDSAGTNGSATSDASRINFGMVGADNEIILDQVYIKTTSIGNVSS